MPASTRDYGLPLGQKLVQELQQESRYVFNAAEAQKIGRRLHASNVNDLLHRLTQAGLVRRLRRGYYAVAAATPSVPEIPEFYIATRMLEPSAISHWSAMSHHGLTDQIPRRITAFTPKKFITPAMRKSRRTESNDRNKSGQFWEVDHVRYEYLYVLPQSFFGIEEIWLGELFKVPITDKERTLLEGFINPTYFGGFSVIMSILEQHLASLNLPKLVKYALQYETGSVIKRLGWAFQQLSVAEQEIAPLRAISARGYTLLDPALSREGEYDSQWKIINNLRASGGAR